MNKQNHKLAPKEKLMDLTLNLYPYIKDLKLEDEFAEDEFFNTAQECAQAFKGILPRESQELIASLKEGLYIFRAQTVNNITKASLEDETRIDLRSNEELALLYKKLQNEEVITQRSTAFNRPKGTFIANGKFIGHEAIVTSVTHVTKSKFIVSFIFKMQHCYCLGAELLSAAGCEVYEGMPVIVEYCTNHQGERTVSLLANDEALQTKLYMQQLNKALTLVGVIDNIHLTCQNLMLILGIVGVLGFVTANAKQLLPQSVTDLGLCFFEFAWPLMAVLVSFAFGVIIKRIGMKTVQTLVLNNKTKAPIRGDNSFDDIEEQTIIHKIVRTRYFSKWRFIYVFILVPALVVGVTSLQNI